MKTGVLVLNFGEPSSPTEEEVVPFLERIFFTNADLEDAGSPEAARRRSRELAERRAPGLIEEYRTIGGSPLTEQAVAQARALEGELLRRGHEAHTYPAMQFTDPLVPDVVERARADGMDRLVALPVYPLCGASTTVAALDEVEGALRSLEWDADVRSISGWHRHPLYTELRAEGVRSFTGGRGVDLSDPSTTLVFSAHGTPLKYLREGNRYEEYVHESSAAIAEWLGTREYVIGYQNHTNRRIEWTQPDIDQVIRELEAEAVVVVPLSFMHEQSETLVELDRELREEAERQGLAFHRVPVPHDDPRFSTVLADLVEGALALRGDAAGQAPGALTWGACRCRPVSGTFCLNAPVAS